MPRFRHLLAIAAGVSASGGLLSAAGCTPVPPPLCSASQLVPHLESSQGGVGRHFDIWQLINVGGNCHTQGWVGTRNYGPDGRPLATVVTDVQAPAHPVILGHGQHASWTFTYRNPAIVGCVAENAPAQLITPPDNVLSVLAHPGEAACGGVVETTPLLLGG